ncbi:13498_t:CDS:1, partial [Acaulospora morrowiae]
YDTGYLNCTGTCKVLDYNSPSPTGRFKVQIHEYNISKDEDGERDICYEMSGSKATWDLGEVDCNKFSGVTPCPNFK